MFKNYMTNRIRFRIALIFLIIVATACSARRIATDSIELVEEMPDINDYDRPPILAKYIKPEYSQATADIGISGKVILKILVRKDGTVGKIQVVEASDPLLAKSVIEAASKFVFEPATKNGRPKRATIVIPFVFKSG
ncbi:MAG: energy transducer TonB [bacterium]